jgi:hypothetical protein
MRLQQLLAFESGLCLSSAAYRKEKHGDEISHESLEAFAFRPSA